MDKVKFLDLFAMHEPLLPQLKKAINGIISSSGFIGGEHVKSFEDAYAKYCQSSWCVGVANGTDALMLALRSLGVGKGDAVLVPAHTFIATAEAVSMLGAKPRFVDVDPVTYTMSPDSLRDAMWDDVKVVIPVHLYGQPADMDEIKIIAQKHDAYVVEDAAQAHGATYGGKKVGSLADLACFSFYPGKNLGAFGDGGAIVGSKMNFAERIRRIADHGRFSKYEHTEIGVNSRLDAIQAAVLAIKLPQLDKWNIERRIVADWYSEQLKDLSGIVLPTIGKNRTHVYHLYVIQIEERKQLMKSFEDAGISCGIHYERPLHQQVAYEGTIGYVQKTFANSTRIAKRCLSLPMHPCIKPSEVELVCGVIRKHLKAGS